MQVTEKELQDIRPFNICSNYSKHDVDQDSWIHSFYFRFTHQSDSTRGTEQTFLNLFENGRDVRFSI